MCPVREAGHTVLHEKCKPRRIAQIHNVERLTFITCKNTSTVQIGVLTSNLWRFADCCLAMCQPSGQAMAGLLFSLFSGMFRRNDTT